MNTDIRTQPKVRTTMIFGTPSDDNEAVFKAKTVVISLWLLFGSDAPQVRREVLEAN